MTRNTDTPNKKVGVNTIYCKLVRLLIVACGTLYHSSSMAVRSCWILGELEHAVVHVDLEHTKLALWVTPGEYAVHGRTGTF